MEELEVVEVPIAWKVTPWVGPVPAVTLRSVKADTRWLAYVRLKATPTAASVPPAASPEPTVIALAVIVAVTSTAPLTEIAGPVPIEATTVTFEIAMAIAGATATLPLAPVRASVVIVCLPEASSVRAAPPVRTAVSSIEATVLSLTMWTAIEAPTPTDLPVPPSLEASALRRGGRLRLRLQRHVARAGGDRGRRVRPVARSRRRCLVVRESGRTGRLPRCARPRR